MAVVLPFTSMHVSSFATRGAQLERIGEELQDPYAFVRAARLYMLAVHIADDIDNRPALPFTHADLARVRDELRTLATDTITGTVGLSGPPPSGLADTAGDLTRAFREVALRIEQRLATGDHRPQMEIEPRA